MGKASSTKKVARVARAAGGPSRQRAQLGFPAVVFVVCLVGTLMVVWARSGRDTASAEAPTLADHWHAAYGIYVCDAFLPPLQNVNPDTTGINTHDDGIIHVHPFATSATGKNANWKAFGDVAGLTFDGTSFTLSDGTSYGAGHDCAGTPAEVVLYQWPADDPAAEPVVHRDDLGSVHFGQDRLAFTLAVVAPGTTPPRPESVPTLDNLSDDPNSIQSQTGDTTGDTTGGTAPAGAVPGDTVPVIGEPSDPPSTTAAAESPTTAP